MNHGALTGVTATVVLSIRRDDGEQWTQPIAEGVTIIVGSDANCSLRLTGEGLSPMHCLLSFVDGRLQVQDWCSNTGTFVNGQRIGTDSPVEADGEIRVGNYTIRATQRATSSASVAHAAGKQAAGAQTARSSQVAVPDTQHVEDAAALDAHLAETESLLLQASAEPSAEWPNQDDHPVQEHCAPAAAESPEQETIAMLRSEVELLQSELAQRDAQLEELTALMGTLEAPRPEEAPADAGVGAERFEQLLEELERSDQRLRLLEEMLQTSDDANFAAQEERQQLEAWLHDIEQRIGQREAEWQAENEGLRRQLQDISAERNRAEQKLAHAAAHNSADLQDHTLTELRQQIEQLQSQLQASQQRCQSFETQLKQAQHDATQAAQEEKIEEAIREERLKLAQERAALSRQRADLMKQYAELEKQMSVHKPACEADERFRAFRQHLKEIHNQEQQQPNRPSSFSQRLGNLWHRLEGRTDTD